jgi:hypothetical protein
MTTHQMQVLPSFSHSESFDDVENFPSICRSELDCTLHSLGDTSLLADDDDDDDDDDNSFSISLGSNSTPSLDSTQGSPPTNVNSRIPTIASTSSKSKIQARKIEFKSAPSSDEIHESCSSE